MKKVFLLTTFMVLLFLTGCGFLYGTPETKSKTIIDISEAGWEVPSFEFTNHKGENFGSKDLEGQYWLANMIFASCPTVCQTMTPNMITIQEKAKKEGINLQFVSFTVDPDFDDPNILTNYGIAYQADFSNYHFLTGYTVEEITDFSREAFKSLVMKEPNSKDITHSVNFFLVDGEGNVLRIYDGDTDFNEKLIIKDLKSIIR